jgi:hypothetical protein
MEGRVTLPCYQPRHVYEREQVKAQCEGIVRPDKAYHVALKRVCNIAFHSLLQLLGVVELVVVLVFSKAGREALARCSDRTLPIDNYAQATNINPPLCMD